MYPIYPYPSPDQLVDPGPVNATELLLALLIIGGIMAGGLLIAYWSRHRHDHRDDKHHAH